MAVILGGHDTVVLEIFPDISPDLSHLEVRVHLDNLQFLLFLGSEVVSTKAHPIKHREDYQSDIILLNLLPDAVDEVGFCACFCEIFEVGWLGYIFLLFLWDKWFFVIYDDSLLVFYSVFLVLLAVEFDH